MTLLNRFEAIPFELELRDTLDAALYNFEQLQKAAQTWLGLDSQIRNKGTFDADDFQTKTRQQTHVFDALEAFLASWARVSLLMFPVGSDAFTIRRGKTLQKVLELDQHHPLSDRELRNSWMHFDERLDQAVGAGESPGRQRFMRSSDVTPDLKRSTLRLIEVDTLVVHHRDRNGKVRTVDLRELKGALEAIDKARDSAFDQLVVPNDDAT